MASLVINDVLEELTEENNRLLNELKFAKKCLKVLIEFKTTFDLYSNHFKYVLESNEWKKFEKLNKVITEFLFEQTINCVVEENANKTDIDLNVNSNDVISGQTLIDNDSPEEESTSDWSQSFDSNSESNKNEVNNEFGDKDSQEITSSYNTRHRGLRAVKDFECDICHQKFFIKSFLISHKRKVHKISRQKKCPKCLKPILTDERYRVHLEMHENNGQFKCWHNGCRKVFDTEDKAVYHLSYHKRYVQIRENPGKRLRFCHWPGCNFKGVCQSAIDKHRFQVHSPEEITRRFVCDQSGCGKKFKNSGALDVHKQTHLSGTEVECDICHKYYRNDKTLKAHKINFHSEAKDVRIDRTRTRLNTGCGKPYVCTVDGCDKRFRNEFYLNKHLISHSDTNQYICPFEGCSKAFGSKTRVKRHYRTVHSGRQFSCDWPGCDFRTTNSQSHRRHYIRAHRPERDFVCQWPECGKTFKEKGRLTCHIRIHTKEKPYLCSWPGCDYSSTNASNANKHRKQVHEKTSNYYRGRKKVELATS